jgi:transcriptional regulator with XRE-family HTH domain
MTTQIHTFAQRLTALREAAGLTQYALAAAAGLHRSQVMHFERGTRGPTLATAVRLAQALGKRLRDFEGLAWPEKVPRD